MKCNHDVKDYEWAECSKCGNTVRLSIRRRVLHFVLLFFFIGIFTPKMTDWALEVLNQSGISHHKLIAYAIGCALAVFCGLFVDKLVPEYIEKQ